MDFSHRTMAIHLTLLVHLGVIGCIASRIHTHKPDIVNESITIDFRLADPTAPPTPFAAAPGNARKAKAVMREERDGPPLVEQASPPVTPPPAAPASPPETPLSLHPSNEVITLPEPTPIVLQHVPPAQEPAPDALVPQSITQSSPTPTRGEYTGKIGAPAGENGAVSSSPATPGQGDGGNGASQYLRENYAFIRDLIYRNLVYPEAAKKNGWTGIVLASFSLEGDGQVTEVNILASSSHSLLDNAVVATIRRLTPFPKPPTAARIILPVKFSLR